MTTRSPWTYRQTVLGSAVWILALVVNGPTRGFFSVIQFFLWLAVLVIVPLGARLLPAAAGRALEVEEWAAYLQPIAAPLAVASFFMPTSEVAGVLVTPWILTTSLIAVSALLRLRSRSRDTAFTPALVGAALLPLGAVALALSRLGQQPGGYPEPIVLLTAIHYHYSAFAAPVFQACVTRHIRTARVSAAPVANRATWLSVGATLLLAAGFALYLREVQMIAAVLLSGSLLLSGLLLLATVRTLSPLSARLLLLLATTSMLVAMVLASYYATGEYFGTHAISIPRMVFTHGLLNGLGFSLMGLIGWNVASAPRTPKIWLREWRSWIAACLAGLLVMAVMLGLATAVSSWGYSTVLAAPLVAGIWMGVSGGGLRKPLILMTGLLIAGVVVSAITLELAGVMCALILAAIVIVPTLVGVAIGRWITWVADEARRRRTLRRLLLVAAALICVEPLSTPAHEPEEIVTRVVIDRPAAEVWNRLTFYENVDLPRPALAMIGLPEPLRAEGRATRVDDTIRCVYRSGHLTKRITRFEPGHLLAFDVIEQQGVEDRSAELVGGRFDLRPLDSGRTELTLSTFYRPLLQARAIWRPFEVQVARALHRQVLAGMEDVARLERPPLVAQMERSR